MSDHDKHPDEHVTCPTCGGIGLQAEPSPYHPPACRDCKGSGKVEAWEAELIADRYLVPRLYGDY